MSGSRMGAFGFDARALRRVMVFALLVGLLVPVSGVARAAELLFVDNTDAGCDDVAGTPYCSIQAAIDAAEPGDTVDVAAGTYDEQVVIDGKSLTLQGAGDMTIIAPSSAAVLTSIYTTGTQSGAFFNTTAIASIIDVRNVGSAGVMIRDLKVDGESITSLPVGASWVSGITYGETGGLIDDVTVEDTKFVVPASVRTYGIWVDAVADTALSVDVTNSTVQQYGRNGINARGDDITVLIYNNTITGPGMAGPDQVPNGVLLIDGALGTVSNNTVTAHHYTGSSSLASGVLLFRAGDNIEISGNGISDVDDAVILNATDFATVEGNDLSDNAKGVRIEAGSAADNTITNNTIDNNSLVGIELSDTVGTGNAASNNSISGNATGVSNNSTNLFDATCNWWGDPSGPSGDGPGTGDSVSGNVLFGDWLMSSDLDGPCGGPPPPPPPLPTATPFRTCRGLDATVVGTDGDDEIHGTDGDDVIVGLGGNDTIDGLGGNDVICGGDGEDVLRGGSGDDVLDGGVGGDVLRGGLGNDELYAKKGHDRLRGGADDDLLFGGRGNDRLNGNDGNDVLRGGQGDDTGRNGPTFISIEEIL